VIKFFSRGQCVEFSREYGRNNPVPRRTVYNIIMKFRIHGTVLNGIKDVDGGELGVRNTGSKWSS
jgi:hypothetical protein